MDALDIRCSLCSSMTVRSCFAISSVATRVVTHHATSHGQFQLI